METSDAGGRWSPFFYSFSVQTLLLTKFWELKGTPRYQNQVIFHWLSRISENERWYFYLHSEIKKHIFSWPVMALPLFCLSFSALRHGRSPAFLSCGPKLRPLYFCEMNLCGDGVGRYGLNGSQLRINFNSKIISWNSYIAQNEFLLASLMFSTHNLS